ncbi:MAG TPA: DUF4148 domain-containing protein, partial [Steroidobacteraceae bacterium]|nr:DUF4148 domain-containing protein [Steroidobacteraceae bacterium]
LSSFSKTLKPSLCAHRTFCNSSSDLVDKSQSVIRRYGLGKEKLERTRSQVVAELRAVMRAAYLPFTNPRGSAHTRDGVRLCQRRSDLRVNPAV